MAYAKPLNRPLGPEMPRAIRYRRKASPCRWPARRFLARVPRPSHQRAGRSRGMLSSSSPIAEIVAEAESRGNLLSGECSSHRGKAPLPGISMSSDKHEGSMPNLAECTMGKIGIAILSARYLQKLQCWREKVCWY